MITAVSKSKHLHILPSHQEDDFRLKKNKSKLYVLRSTILFCHFERVEKIKVNFKRLSDLLGLILMRKHAKTVSCGSSYLPELHVIGLVLSIYLLNNNNIDFHQLGALDILTGKFL